MFASAIVFPPNGAEEESKAFLGSLVLTPGTRVPYTSVGWLPFVAGGSVYVFCSVDAGLDGRQ